jgi:hypothetical protein
MAGKQNDCAVVVPFNPKRNGLAYVLKLINQPQGDWGFGKLHLALPGSCAKNHRERRNLQRHQNRQTAFASAKFVP